MRGVDRNAGHRAHLHALRFVKMANALGASGGVDLVNDLAQVNGLVGAFGFAHIAIDAFVGDHQGHVRIITAGPVFPAGTGADTPL